MRLCESKVNSASDYNVNFKQKVEAIDRDKVFGQASENMGICFRQCDLNLKMGISH